MGRRRKSNTPEKLKSEQKFSGLGRSVREDVFMDVILNFSKTAKEDFGKVLVDFRVAIINDYLKNSIDPYKPYTKEDMLRLNQLANEKAVSYMKKHYFKFTEGK